ncbi:MAG: hypothetical protein FWF27_00945 [Candidatus Bathyarchaeota archaeon]|nr:hypothetical protein [Candidatus Termiticorpusculum sp.]
MVEVYNNGVKIGELIDQNSTPITVSLTQISNFLNYIAVKVPGNNTTRINFNIVDSNGTARNAFYTNGTQGSLSYPTFIDNSSSPSKQTSPPEEIRKFNTGKHVTNNNYQGLKIFLSSIGSLNEGIINIISGTYQILTSSADTEFTISGDNGGFMAKQIIPSLANYTFLPVFYSVDLVSITPNFFSTNTKIRMQQIPTQEAQLWNLAYIGVTGTYEGTVSELTVQESQQAFLAPAIITANMQYLALSANGVTGNEQLVVDINIYGSAVPNAWLEVSGSSTGETEYPDIEEPPIYPPTTPPTNNYNIYLIAAVIGFFIVLALLFFLLGEDRERKKERVL